MFSLEPSRKYRHSGNEPDAAAPAQVYSTSSIGTWFDDIYTAKGFSYLRSPNAYSVFLHLLRPEQGNRLLDVGCGPGRLLSHAEGYGLEAHGVDLSRVALTMLNRAGTPARVQAGDAANLPYKDESFSYITCIGALERMPELEVTLTELWRVARPGARLCFLVRNSRTLTWRVLIEGLSLKNRAGHQGAASLEEWRRRFESVGFRVEAVYPDQWNLVLIERVLSHLGRTVDFNRIRAGWLPLRYANEFIFVASKAST